MVDRSGRDVDRSRSHGFGNINARIYEKNFSSHAVANFNVFFDHDLIIIAFHEGVPLISGAVT